MKEEYPKKIGLFNRGVTYFLSEYSEAYYHYNDFRLQISKGFVKFNYEVVLMTPMGVYMKTSGKVSSLQECIDLINEWCFLNDNLFVRLS